MQHLYSLETETQADVENLKYAYITELETENKNLKMQLEEIQSMNPPHSKRGALQTLPLHRGPHKPKAKSPLRHGRRYSPL
mgnify:CR=1 FL=1